MEKQKVLQKLKCPSCDHEILSDDVNISKLVAKCGHCNSIFNFKHNLPALARERPEVYLPSGIEAYSFLSELNMEVSWRKSANSFLIFFTILWNAFMFFWITISLASGSYEMILFGGLHIAIGVALLYYSVATILNTTYIVVDERRLTIKHKPLWTPFNPSRDIPAGDVEQLYTEKYTASKTNGKPDYAFKVAAKLNGGETVALVKGLKNSQQALYIEQEVERFLDIPDRPVEEEWKG